jgi:hypothetical protein
VLGVVGQPISLEDPADLLADLAGALDQTFAA